MDELLERLARPVLTSGPRQEGLPRPHLQPARLCDRRRAMGLLRSRRQPRRTIWRVTARQAARRGDRRPSRHGGQRRALSRAVRRNFRASRRAGAVRRPHQFRQDERGGDPRRGHPRLPRSRCSACSATTIMNAASRRRSAEILHEAGMTVLDEQAVEIEGVGFAGVKGFIGGFGRGELAPFGEPHRSRPSSTRR